MINTLLSYVLSNRDKSDPIDLLICKKGVINIYNSVIVEDSVITSFLDTSKVDIKLEGHELITLTELEALCSYFTESQNNEIKFLLSYGFKNSLNLLSDIKNNCYQIYNSDYFTEEDYVYDCSDETYKLDDEVFICVGISKYKAVVKKITDSVITVMSNTSCLYRVHFKTEPVSHDEERIDHLIKVSKHNKIMNLSESRRLKISLFENYLSNYDRLIHYLNE